MPKERVEVDYIKDSIYSIGFGEFPTALRGLL
jgi:hypothetical protein